MTPYANYNGTASIGIGFSLADRQVFNAVIQQVAPALYADSAKSNALFAITSTNYGGNSTAAQTAINNQMQQYHAQNSSIPQTLAYNNVHDMQGAFQIASQQYENRINSWQSGIPQSVERLALLSLSYNQTGNSSTQLTPALAAALQNQQRPEAVYQIRYNSNPNATTDIAARRFYEAATFQLYKNPAQVNITEALGAGQTYATHNAVMDAYETQFASQISAANSRYNTTAVQPLNTWLQPAIALIKAQYNVTSATPIDRLQADTTPANQTIGNDMMGTPFNELMLATHGSQEVHGYNGNDILIALQGNIAFFGNKGNDTSIANASTPNTFHYDTGDGHDIIIGANNASEITYNTVPIRGTAQQVNSASYMLNATDGTNWQMTKINATGGVDSNGQHLKITQGDGSDSMTVQSFQNGNLGITLNNSLSTHHNTTTGSNGPGPDVIDMPGEVILPPIHPETSVPSSTALPGSPQASTGSNIDVTTAASVIGGVALVTAIGAYAYKNREIIGGYMKRSFLGRAVQGGIRAVEGGMYLANSISSMIGYGAETKPKVNEPDIEMGITHDTPIMEKPSNVIQINIAATKSQVAITIDPETVAAAKVKFTDRFPPKQARAICPTRPRSSSFTEAEKLRRMPKTVNEV